MSSRNAPGRSDRRSRLGRERREPFIGFEGALLVRALVVALPALLLAGAFLWQRGRADAVFFTVTGVVAVLTLFAAVSLRRYVVFPLYTVTNLLEALREGDYSLRGTRARSRDAIGDVVWEANALADLLAAERRRAEETGALLSKVVSAIDIALFTFDDRGRLRMLNPAARRLLRGRQEKLVDRTAEALGLSELLAVPSGQIRRCEFPGGAGRYDVRHYRFREQGLPHTLLVVTDLSRTLRDEERQTWQRLIRVLGHELNNSLAPIKSLSGTLTEIARQQAGGAEGAPELEEGLALIGARSEALARFLEPYTRLARLPPPDRRAVPVRALLEKLPALERRVPVRLGELPDTVATVDPDQIEQALINLLKNAAEASLEGRGGGVVVGAEHTGGWLTIEIADDGPGTGDSDNLFVPFYSTKPGGSGIGLVLAQSIAEAHGGVLTLTDRGNGPGCVARLTVPLQPGPVATSAGE